LLSYHNMGKWRAVIYRTDEDKKLLEENKLEFLQQRSLLMKRIWQFTRPHMWTLLWSLFLLFALKALRIVNPLIFKQLIDDAIPNKNLSQINLLAFGKTFSCLSLLCRSNPSAASLFCRSSLLLLLGGYSWTGSVFLPLCTRLVSSMRERATTHFAHSLTQSLKRAIYASAPPPIFLVSGRLLMMWPPRVQALSKNGHSFLHHHA